MECKFNKVEHIWHEKDDRWIYIERDEQMKIIGVNFMQCENYEYFKEGFCHNNEGFFGFYKEMISLFPIEQKSVDTIEFISKCMWAFHTAVSYYDEFGL